MYYFFPFPEHTCMSGESSLYGFQMYIYIEQNLSQQAEERQADQTLA